MAAATVIHALSALALGPACADPGSLRSVASSASVSLSHSASNKVLQLHRPHASPLFLHCISTLGISRCRMLSCAPPMCVASEGNLRVEEE